MKNFTQKLSGLFTTAFSLLLLVPNAAKADETITIATLLPVGEYLMVTAYSADSLSSVTVEGATGDFDNGYLNFLETTSDTIRFTIKNGTWTSFAATNNELTFVDLSKAPSVQTVDFSHNLIKNVKFAKDSKLLALGLAYNELESLDLSQSNWIAGLSISHNNIKSIDLSKCLNLQTLNAEYNDIDSLDFSKNKYMFEIYAGNNRRLKNFSTANLDSLMQLSLDTTGVDAVDVTKNTKLVNLLLDGTKVKSVDVTKNPDLESLYVPNLGLTELDISKNNKLMNLRCEMNKLTELTFGDCFDLQTLVCFGNQIESLDLSGMNYLADLWCYDNKLTELYLGDCASLHELNCSFNELEELDLSQCTILTVASVFNNKLKTLKLPTSFYLTNIACFSNKLTDAAVAQMVEDIWTADSMFIGGFKLFAVNTKSTDFKEQNIFTKEHVDAFKNKNWVVYDYDLDTDTPTEYGGIMSVKDLRNAEVKVTYDPTAKNINITGVGAGELVSIISTNGQLVRSTLTSNNNTNISARGIAEGVYMVVVKGQTTKISIH